MTKVTVTFDPALWQVVPKEPTDVMFDAGLSGSSIRDTIRRAIAAAPQPPSVQVPDIVPGEKRVTFDDNGNSCIGNLVYRDHAVAVKVALEDELSEHRAFMAQLKGQK